MRVGLYSQCSSYPVVSEVVFLRQPLDSRVNLEVVEDVDAFHVTEAVVQDSRQLRRQRHTNRDYYETNIKVEM